MPKSKTVPALLVGVSMLSVASCVVALSVVYWVESNTDNDDNYTGLFLKESENREIANNCNSDMSTTECGYLKSAKSCGVISVLFGALAVGMYIRSYLYHFDKFFATVTGIVNVVQTVFGIICLVVYSHFKRTYLTQTDDLNVEYNDHLKSTYEWAFYFMVASTVLAFLVTIVNMMFVKNPSACAKLAATGDMDIKRPDV